MLANGRMFTHNIERTFAVFSAKISLTWMLFYLFSGWVEDLKLFRFRLHILSEINESMQGNIRLLNLLKWPSWRTAVHTTRVFPRSRQSSILSELSNGGKGVGKCLRLLHAPAWRVCELRDSWLLSQPLIDLIVSRSRPRVVLRYAVWFVCIETWCVLACSLASNSRHDWLRRLGH